MPLPRIAHLLCYGLILAGCGQEPVADAPIERPIPALGEMPTKESGLGLHARLSDELRNLDPAEVGWASEVFSEIVGQAMNIGIGAVLAHPEDQAEEALASMLSPDIVSTALRPQSLSNLYRQHEMVILQGEDEQLNRHRGTLAFRKALTFLSQPLADGSHTHAKFKVMHVKHLGEIVEAHFLFEMRGQLNHGWRQITSTWQTQWTAEEPHRLKRVRVTDYREASPGEGKIVFEDIAPQVLASTEGYDEQLARSFDYWRARSDRSLVADLLGAQGVVVGDVNGDLLDDVYVLQPGGLPNRLFLHQPDGTAKDISLESSVNFLDFCRSALLIDLDNDSDQDLVVGLAWAVVLYENDGKGHFTQRKKLPSEGQINSMAATDYDGDGLIDVYVCGRDASSALKAEQGALGIPMPYYDANNGGPNMLLRNQGDFSLTDVTQEVGMNANNQRFSLACAWEDYDDDGDQDLYVANDFGRNNLFRNDDGTFTDVAVDAGVVDIGPGMSASWGDHNGDGFMDLYVGNMWSNAGNRITPQKAFLPGGDEATRNQARRHARGNSVYVNSGDGTFKDATQTSGANRARWAWSSNFIDLNNDGAEDLVVANGMITTDDTGDL